MEALIKDFTLNLTGWTRLTQLTFAEHDSIIVNFINKVNKVKKDYSISPDPEKRIIHPVPAALII